MQSAVLERSQLEYKGLVPEKLWGRLTGRIMERELLSRETAERIVNETLGFLKLCADFPRESFSPSPLVDLGWHSFLVYTREYGQFCRAHAGRFLHHAPNDDPDRTLQSGGSARTMRFMEEHDISFDHELWSETGQDCDDGNGPPINCTCS